MLKVCLFGAVLALTLTIPYRLPEGISLEPHISNYGSNDTVPSSIVRGWFVDEVLRRDPDLTPHRDMIATFFEESVGTGGLACHSISEKVDAFLRRDFPKKVDAMQEYLIRLYKIDRTDSEFIDEMKKHPESYFLTYDSFKVLKDYTEEPERGIGEL